MMCIMGLAWWKSCGGITLDTTVCFFSPVLVWVRCLSESSWTHIIIMYTNQWRTYKELIMLQVLKKIRLRCDARQEILWLVSISICLNFLNPIPSEENMTISGGRNSGGWQVGKEIPLKKYFSAFEISDRRLCTHKSVYLTMKSYLKLKILLSQGTNFLSKSFDFISGLPNFSISVICLK